MKNYYLIRIYFSKSYLKPHTENYIDVVNSEKNRIISKLKRRKFDTFREEMIEK